MEANKININEIFGPTIQGEGKFTGVPSVFVRTNGCNLRCAFAGGSLCDTPYTSHNPERTEPMSITDVATDIIERIGRIGDLAGENSHIVLTGGEPMLQQKAIKELIVELREVHDAYNQITIETNGSIEPSFDLLGKGIFWSVSPKLATSCCFEGTDVPETQQMIHKRARINIEALSRFVTSDDDYQLKFVYSGPESVAEIKQIVEDVKKHIWAGACGIMPESRIQYWCDHIDEHIMLMPEGITNDQISKSAEEAVQTCIKNGWRFCDRLHIRIYGDKRAV